MNPNAILERARLLMSQNRMDQAEELLGQVLPQLPQDSDVYCLLALCVMRDRDRLKEASELAQQGIVQDPNSFFSYYVHSIVLQKRNQVDLALQEIRQAIALAPWNSEVFAVQCALLIAKKDWAKALDSAEQGLAADPEDEQCASYRSHCLERLGRVGDAMEEAERLVANQPDSSSAHSSLGWAQLNKGQFRKAQNSFREALRLDPSDEFARSGMRESIHSTSLIYRMFFWLMMKLDRLPAGIQTAVLIGFWFGMQAINSVAASVPWLKPTHTLLIALCFFSLVMATWILPMLFNLFLRFHPFGKHLLSRREKWESGLMAGCVAIGLLMPCLTLVAMPGVSVLEAFVFSIFAFHMAIPIRVAFMANEGWPRWVTGIVGGCFFTVFLVIVMGPPLNLIFGQLVMPYVWGIMIYSFVGPMVANRVPAR